MEWPIAWAADAKAEMAAAKHPRIRLVRAMHKVSDYPVENLVGQMWRECTPESAENFSAVAYHFGRLLQQKLDIPIGLIQTAWGGTPIDAWTSLGAISQDPALMPVFAEWNTRMQDYALDLLRYDRAAKAWEKAPAPRGPVPEKPVGPGGPYTPGGTVQCDGRAHHCDADQRRDLVSGRGQRVGPHERLSTAASFKR